MSLYKKSYSVSNKSRLSHTLSVLIYDIHQILYMSSVLDSYDYFALYMPKVTSLTSHFTMVYIVFFSKK